MKKIPYDGLGRTVDELRASVTDRMDGERLGLNAVVAEYLETGAMTFDRARELIRDFRKLGYQREVERKDVMPFFDPNPLLMTYVLLLSKGDWENTLRPSPEQLEQARERHARWLAGEDFGWPRKRSAADE